MFISLELRSAIIKSVLGKYSLYIVQMVSLGVLSRIFSPEYFGEVAAIQIFIYFFQFVVNSSLGPAVIFENSISISQRNGIFTATFIIGVFFSVLSITLSPFLVSWLNLHHIILFSIILSVNVFFSAISMLPMACIQKDAKFIHISTAEILSEISSLLICIYLYATGYGFTALGAKLITVPGFRFLFYLLFSKSTNLGMPVFGSNISSIYILLKFVKYQMAFNILNFFSRNLDTLLITKFFGLTIVGLYDKSYQVMRYPLQLFTFAINPALQPVLTKYRDDRFLVYAEYNKIILKLSILGIIMSFVMFWCAQDILFIMFGPQWVSASDYLKVFAVSVPLQMVLSSTGGIFQTFGKTKLQFYCGLFGFVVSVTSIFLGIYFDDLVLLCTLLVLGYVLNYFQCFYVLIYHVFERRVSKGAAFIFIIVIIPYFNLFFLNFNFSLSDDYVFSFLRVSLVSVVSVIVSGFIFFIVNSSKEKDE